MEALQNVEDATQVGEFWINLFNKYGFDCQDNACQSGKLTTNDGQTISLGVFDKVEINDDERCIKSKKIDIWSVDCDHKLEVVCEKNCQVATTMTTSPNPAPCHNMGSVQSNENQKFYKAVDSPGGYQSAHEACAASDMELADISTDEGIKAIHETLGTGPFWLSTYNPSARECTTPTSCYSILRNGYGSYIRYNWLSSNMDINITPARCVQVTCNIGSIKLESLDCQSTLKVACESSCALQTKGGGYDRCPIPPVGPHPIIYETTPSSFKAGATLQLRNRWKT
ncbi:uncharacterized protein LOC131885108 isoform X2 [Tigriopus californicus]|nr:uncharacterized protein LOC131885108 isoform X2 [Tigriopus californicus]